MTLSCFNFLGITLTSRTPDIRSSKPLNSSSSVFLSFSVQLNGSDIVTSEDPYGMLAAYIYTIPPPSTKGNGKGKEDDDNEDSPSVQAAVVVANDPASAQWTVLYAVYRWTTIYGTCSTTSPCLLYSAFFATFVKPTAVSAPKRRLLQDWFIDAVKGAVSGCKKCKYVSGKYVCVPC